MNNYSNYPNNYNCPSNLNQQFMNNNTMDNSNMNKFNNMMNNYNSTNLYDPYQGFIRGNMFPQLYSPYKIDKPYDIRPMNEQAQLLTYIDALCFAKIDLNLYLDTNPNDQTAIDLFNQYRVQEEQLKMEYESKYGPLLLNSDALSTHPWAWIDRPWPWDK